MTTTTQNRTRANVILSLKDIRQARLAFADLCVFCAEGHENEKDAVAESLFGAETRFVKGSKSRVSMPVDEHSELLELIDHLAAVSVPRESHVEVQVSAFWSKLASMVSRTQKGGA